MAFWQHFVGRIHIFEPLHYSICTTHAAASTARRCERAHLIHCLSLAPSHALHPALQHLPRCTRVPFEPTAVMSLEQFIPGILYHRGVGWFNHILDVSGAPFPQACPVLRSGTLTPYHPRPHTHTLCPRWSSSWTLR